MSDTIDDFRFMRDLWKAKRKLFGVPCALCEKVRPRACPTILLPQQRCRVCGNRDARPDLTVEQFNDACREVGL